jgi:hypothetical protein
LDYGHDGTVFQKQGFKAARLRCQSTVEGVTSEEAETIYTEARTNRAKSGFVHS